MLVALIRGDRQKDGWTDMKKLIGAFRHNENGPKKSRLQSDEI